MEMISTSYSFAISSVIDIILRLWQEPRAEALRSTHAEVCDQADQELRGLRFAMVVEAVAVAPYTS